MHFKRPRYLWYRASEEPIASSGGSTYKNKHPEGLARALKAIKGVGPPQIAPKSRTGYCSSGPVITFSATKRFRDRRILSSEGDFAGVYFAK